jgi:hypothetical protein
MEASGGCSQIVEASGMLGIGAGLDGWGLWGVRGKCIEIEGMGGDGRRRWSGGGGCEPAKAWSCRGEMLPLEKRESQCRMVLERLAEACSCW